MMRTLSRHAHRVRRTPRSAIDLSAFANEDGIALISPPQSFDGGEDAYDATVGGAQSPDLLRSGRGAWRLVAHHAARPIELLLELGAGGGTCSLGLLDAAGEGATVLLTDTSPAFLRIIRRKLPSTTCASERVRFATLAGEDLGKLPADSLDAIVIASALHHVSDWRAFLCAAARVLRPGGVLAAQEPCREGNLMMAMILDVALDAEGACAGRFADEDARKLAACRDSIYFLADSTIEKVGEDKHSFLVSEMIDAGTRAGFAEARCYANRHFGDLLDADLGAPRSSVSLLRYLDSFLEHHHRLSADALTAMRERVYPLFARLDARFVSGDGAALLGCFVMTKPIDPPGAGFAAFVRRITSR